MTQRSILFKMIFVLVFVVVSCRNETEPNLNELIENGHWLQTEMLLGKKIAESRNDSVAHKNYFIQLEKLSRLRKEFPLKQNDVRQQLLPYFPEIGDLQLDKWETSGQLEMRIIDGEKCYFSRAVSNFFRLNADAKSRKEAIDGKSYDGVDAFQQEVIPGYFEKNIAGRTPFDLQKIKISYTIELDANAVPAGETVRCWLPYPKSGMDRSTEVTLLSANADTFLIAANELDHRTIYMEKNVAKDERTVFSVSYIVQTAAQWFDVKPEQVLPYDLNSGLYKKYTAEQPPHIVFSNEIKTLAKQIVGEEQNPAQKVKLLYYWMNDSIPWAGALEYSVMDCIPEYVLQHRRGDCGMQTFLFLSMARSLGIPCKWQSGWYLLPQEKNLHDWAEVYYEGIGWVPVDLSFKLIDSDNIRIKEFYVNGLDSYRLIVNDDVSGEFDPPKKYYRSEPYDFQRGELEWKGGNLYFDTWDYRLEVEYLNN